MSDPVSAPASNAISDTASNPVLDAASGAVPDSASDTMSDSASDAETGMTTQVSRGALWNGLAMLEAGAFLSGVIGVYRSGYQGIDALFFLCVTLMYVAVQAISRVRHVIDVLTNDAFHAQCVSPSKTRAEVKIEKSKAKALSGRVEHDRA